MQTKTALWLAAGLLIVLTAAQAFDAGGGPVADDYLPPAWGLDFIGTPEQIGTTWWDLQTHTSASRMIAMASDGSIHCTWTKGLNAGATQRLIYYNKKLPPGTWVYGNTGIQINVTAYAGHAMLDLDLADSPVIAYHAGNLSTDLYRVYLWNSTGEHACPTPATPTNDIIYPRVCVDTRGWIHIVAQELYPPNIVTGNLYYTRSQDGGATWIPWQFVAALGWNATMSHTICADRGSGKVAIGWTKEVTSVQTESDVCYVESADGVTWFFVVPNNITNFAGGGHPDYQSSRAYNNMNMLYDDSDNLQIVYTTVSCPTPTIGAKIWHWNAFQGHRYVTGRYAVSPAASAWMALNDPGGQGRSIDRPSLALGPASNQYYIQWVQCTTPGDVSAYGFGNMDVWATYRDPNAGWWMEPVNVTETATPGGTPGNCLSENWANMAEKATTNLHIQYVTDLDAGAIPMMQGTWTNNPMNYQGVPADSILTYVTVDLVPVGAPIIIPAGGGWFDCSVTFTNTGTRVLHFDAWIEIVLPNGSYYDVGIKRLDLTLPRGGSITRSLQQFVPPAAPQGNYFYRACAGTSPWTYPDVGRNEWNSDSFPFSKASTGAGESAGWVCTGWEDEEGTAPVAEAIASTHLLVNSYPNPFNPTTVIAYQLPISSHVSLRVYDTAGRLVADLVDGWREAGTSEVTFDGSGLGAGIYVSRLRAGVFSSSEKLVLVK